MTEDDFFWACVGVLIGVVLTFPIMLLVSWLAG